MTIHHTKQSNCEICKAKDTRIAKLEKEVEEYLRALAEEYPGSDYADKVEAIDAALEGE